MSLRHMFQAILLLFAVGVVAPAHAATQFVANTGADSASCTRTAPCATINNAIVNAAPNDTILCLDPISNFFITINKSIDIECTGARAVIRDGGVNDAVILINIPVSANDPRRTVRLRGISVIGGGDLAIRISSAAIVSFEDCVVSDAGLQGILDVRTGGQTKLFITDSIIRNNGGAGIVAAASAPGVAVLDNVRSENNAYGIAVAAGNSVVVNRSVFSGNTNAGVEGDTGSQVVVNNSSISHNNRGVQSNQSVRLSNNDIAFNTTAVSGSSGTFGNNRFSGNGTIGTAPAPQGGASSDLGQQ